MIPPDTYCARLRTIYELATTLQPKACGVLLFSIRDKWGDSLLEPMPRLGIATAAQIAEATGLCEVDVVYLWHQLPADEATIARALGIPRQEVARLMGATHRWLKQLWQSKHTSPLTDSSRAECRAA